MFEYTVICFIVTLIFHKWGSGTGDFWVLFLICFAFDPIVGILIQIGRAHV